MVTSFDENPPTMNGTAIQYMIYQQEQCPETQRLHWQIYVYLKMRKTLSSIKKLFGHSVHAEVARSSHEECVAYCSKEKTRVDGTQKEFGEIETGQGSVSNQWERLREDAETKTMQELVRSHWAISVRNFSGLRQSVNVLKGRPGLIERQTFCLWGPTGVGKTSYAVNHWGLENIFFKDFSGGQAWFDGYEDEEVIVVDEFYGEATMAFVMRMTDRYPIQAPIKGGFVWLRHSTVVFTSNRDPRDWWPNAHPDVLAAFFRRMPPENITHVTEQMPHVASLLAAPADDGVPQSGGGGASGQIGTDYGDGGDG